MRRCSKHSDLRICEHQNVILYLDRKQQETLNSRAVTLEERDERTGRAPTCEIMWWRKLPNPSVNWVLHSQNDQTPTTWKTKPSHSCLNRWLVNLGCVPNHPILESTTVVPNTKSTIVVPDANSSLKSTIVVPKRRQQLQKASQMY